MASVHARQKSELMSAYDIADKVFRRLVQAVQDRGGNDEHVRRLLAEDDLPAKLAGLLVLAEPPTGLGGTPFTIEMAGIPQLINAGNYVETEEFSGRQGLWSQSGPVVSSVALLTPRPVVLTKVPEAIAEIERHGHRSVRLAALLAFINEFGSAYAGWYFFATGTIVDGKVPYVRVDARDSNELGLWDVDTPLPKHPFFLVSNE